MKGELIKQLNEYAERHKWKQFLRGIPVGESFCLNYGTVQELNSLRAVAAMLNSKGQEEGRYSFSGFDYEHNLVVVTVKEIENGSK